MKTTKHVCCMLLAVIMLLSVLPLNTFATSTWPNVTSSHTCAMISPGQIPVYRDSALTTRGTCSPARSYNSYIDKGDDLKFLEITNNYVKVNFPTSQGRKVGYVKTSTILGVSASSQVVTSNAKVTTYQYASKDKSYGYIAVNDTVYKCGTTKSGYVLVIYNVSGGYKAGFITNSDWEQVKNRSENNETTASTGWQWPMSNYKVNQSFNSKRNSSSRPYHCGIDIKSSNTDIYAAASGTVVYKGGYGDNGLHVVISHNINGTNVKTLYSHLSNYDNCPEVGQTVKKGDKIGVMGSTGNSTGAHLHFAIYTGKSNNPWGYASSAGTNKISYDGCTFYNPAYVISNGRLP